MSIKDDISIVKSEESGLIAYEKAQAAERNANTMSPINIRPEKNFVPPLE